MAQRTSTDTSDEAAPAVPELAGVGVPGLGLPASGLQAPELLASPATSDPVSASAAPIPPAGSATAPSRPPLGRRFAAHLTATGLANLGDGIVSTGAPLVALTLTRSPVQIGLLTAAAWLPWLLLGLVAGVLVDRHDRRDTRAVALGARAVLLGAGTVVAVSGRLTMTVLVLLVLAYGVTEVFADLAASSIVPDLVPASRLPEANGRTMAVEQVLNTFVGAPIAGGLLALGAGWVLGLPAGMAVAAVVVTLVGVRGRYRHAPDPARSTGWAQVSDGVRFLAGHPVLRPIVLAGAVMNMATTAYFALFVLWAVGPGSALRLTSATYPLLTAVLAVGAVGGSVVAGQIAHRCGEVAAMIGSWALCGALLVVPVLLPHVAVTAAGILLLGAASTVGNVLSMSLRQRLVPAAMLGRVGGASRTLSFGLMPLGALLGGLAADRWGLAPVLLAAAGIALAATAYPATQVRQRTVAALEVTSAAG